jgi:putative SOS response-associated peptidase YedK
MKLRRCLIPADGFYEWEKWGTKVKQPYNFGMADDALFAFAGLWERWRDPACEFIETFTILTTRPNSLVADVHDRMPAILKPEDYDLWLDPSVTKVAIVADTLKPFDARLMKKWPVGTRVNRAENDDQECVREVLSATANPTLF